MKRIYDFMCKKCWYSWRKPAESALKTAGTKCPKCGSIDVDVSFDVSL